MAKNNSMCSRKRLFCRSQDWQSPARGISKVISGNRGDTCDSRTSYNGSRKTQIIAHSDGPVSRLEIGNDSDEASEPANPGFTACGLLLSPAVPLVIKARSCDSLFARDAGSSDRNGSGRCGSAARRRLPERGRAAWPLVQRSGKAAA